MGYPMMGGWRRRMMGYGGYGMGGYGMGGYGMGGYGKIYKI